MTTLAFIGLGVMGSPMSVNAVRAGHRVVGYNRTPSKAAALVEAGGTAVHSVPKAVADADIVATVLPDSPDVEQTMNGPDGVFAHAKPGTVIVDFSTVRPDVAVRLADQAAERGHLFLDAPVSGGEEGAVNATLSICLLYTSDAADE